jgi:hypothetical protein
MTVGLLNTAVSVSGRMFLNQQRMKTSILSADVEKDGVLTFEKGPIQKSSPIYAIAVVTEDMDAQEEVDLLSEVTMLLTQDFVDVNKTLIVEED